MKRFQYISTRLIAGIAIASLLVAFWEFLLACRVPWQVLAWVCGIILFIVAAAVGLSIYIIRTNIKLPEKDRRKNA